MKIIQPQNALSTKIAVTSTATNPYSLMDTAGTLTTSQSYYLTASSNGVGIGNGILITPEDGDVRLGYGFTPIATVGTLLSAGTKYFIPNISLGNVKLIRAGSSDAACSIDICHTLPSDTFNAVAEAVTLEASSITIGTIDIDKFGGTDVSLGQKTSSASMPVVFPSDQSLGSTILAPTHWTPNDGTGTFTTSTTITTSGFPFTVDDDNCTVMAIYYKPTGGEWQTVLANGNGGVSITASSNVITVVGAGTPFASGDTYLIGIKSDIKGYSKSGVLFNVNERNPLNLQYIPNELDDVTNGTDGTYPYYLDGDSFRKFGLQGTIDGGSGTVTVKIYASNDANASSSTATYHDVSTDIFGTASWTADFFLMDNAEKLACVKWIKVEVVASTTGANDGDWKLAAKQLY